MDILAGDLDFPWERLDKVGMIRNGILKIVIHLII